MAKAQQNFVCQACGAVSGKWSGRCANCGEWNSIVEEAAEARPAGGLGRGGKGRTIAFQSLASAELAVEPRTATGIAELDHVIGGGLVPGSAILVGGDPGIGKSTLLLQAVAALARRGVRCAYISGEEAPEQIALRARRLDLHEAPVELAAATSVRDIVATLEAGDAPHVVVIDSIQTMFVDSIESAPGTVSQVRASAHELIRAGKKRDICILLVGHVTKEGQIAGPRVLEHMVDTVLYFEGERGHQFRILRAVKNRFGPSDEIGVFEMTDRGLAEVSNPSALFLSEHRDAVTGSAVFAGLEGTRPVLVEIQALVTGSPLGTPRRTVVGWDSNRLATIIAVLDARCGLSLGGHDVYLSVAGGLRIGEPAADLAVAATLISSFSERTVPEASVLFGEIGLSGEIRPVSQPDLRMKEAEKLGFTRCIGPPLPARQSRSMATSEIRHLRDLVDEITSRPVSNGRTG